MKKLLLAACAISVAALSAQTTVNFNYTGGMQTFTVPVCVTTVTITCYGAQGQNALVGGATGGLGGSATGELSVTPGQTLNIFVGGQSGYNGGGIGGINGNDQFSGLPIGTSGGTGGGGSDVRVNGTAIADRVIVAGGGGGAGHNGVWPGCQVAGPGGNGGAGGGGTGGTGTAGVGTPCNCGGGGGAGGTGGTQSAGGTHGAYAGSTACLRSSWGAGADGTLFQGGAGSQTSYHNGSGGSGGGGGGYYGGGSGGQGSDTTPGGGGGGGSSYTGGVTNGTTTAGVRTGDGMIVITYSTSGSLPSSPSNFTGNLSVCPGTSVTYSIDVIAGATSYNWTVPGGWSITAGQGTTTVTVTAGTASGSVDVYAVNNCGNGPALSTSVTVFTPPALNLGLDFTNCGPATLTADPASSYAWSTTETTQSIQATSSGTYSVTITDANGCTNSDAIDVTILTAASVDLGQDVSDCNGITLVADSAASYAWGGGETTQSISVTSTGTYSVTVTAASGCTDSDTINVTIFGNPTVVASAAMNLVCFDDDTVQLFGSPAGGVFTGPGLVNSDQFSAAAAGAGTHDMVYSYTDTNGCSAADTTTIVVDLCLGLGDNTNSTFDVFPNPAASTCVIVFANEVKTGTIEITNLQGQVIRSQQVNAVAAGSQVTFDLNGIAAGSYMMNVISGDSKSVRTLIIK